MADENLQATFNEVFEISVDIPKFRESLSELKKAYLQFMSDLGSASGENIFGPGVLQGIKEFKEETQQALAGTIQSVKNLESAFLESLDRVDDKQEQNAEKQRKRVKKSAEDEIAARNTAASKFAQNIDIEQEGTVNKTDLEQIKLIKQGLADIDKARDIAIEQEGIVNRSLEEQSKQKKHLAELDQKQVVLLEKELSLLDRQAARQQQIARDIETEQEGLRNKFGADSLKKDQGSERLRRDIDIEQEGVVNKAKLDSERTSQVQLNSARQIAIEQEGEENRLLAEQAKIREQVAEETRKSQALNGKQGAADANSREARINILLRERVEALNRATEAKRKLDSGDFNKSEEPLREQLRLMREQNQARKEAITAQEKINTLTRQADNAQVAADRQSRGFFGKLINNLDGSIAHLVRFYLMWNAIQGVIAAASAIASAPFKAVAEGVQYLRDTEEQADGLLAVLLSNAKFSEDIAENFKIARTQAVELTKALQQQAIEQNLKPEQIEGTFKALLQGGIGRVEGDLKNIITLASTFQQSLAAAGVGGLAAQGSIQEIGKLMTGNVDSTNKFLTALKATPEEWRKILKESEKSRDLLDTLKDRIAPFRKALEAAQGSQAVLVQNFSLLRKQIEGLAAEKLFTQISEALRFLNHYLLENKAAIAVWFKFFVDSIGTIATQYQQLSQQIGGRGNVIGVFFASLVKDATNFKNAIVEGLFEVRELSAFIESAKMGPSAGPANYKKQKEEIAQARREFREEARLERETMSALLSGRAEPRRRSSGGPAPFTNLANTPPGESRITNLKKDLAEEKQAFDQAVNEVTRVYDRLNDQLKEKLADKQLTYKEYATSLEEINGQEIKKLQQLQDIFDNRALRVRSAVGGDPAKPEQQEEAAKDIDRVRKSAEEVVRKRRETARSEASKAKRDAVKEDNVLEKESIDQRLRINKIGYDLERQAISELESANVLTKKQAFEQETLVLENEHTDRAELLDLELKNYARGTVEFEKATNERAAEQFRYTESLSGLSKRRIRLDEEEYNNKVAYQQRLRSLLLESEALSLQITQDLVPPVGFNTGQDLFLQKKEDELDLLRSELALRLEVSRSKNSESEETRALTLELQGLYNQRLNIVRDRLAQAQGLNNPAIRRMAENDVLQNTSRQLLVRENKLKGDLDNQVIEGPEREAIKREIEETRKQYAEVNRIYREANPNLKSSLKRLLDVFVGFDVKKAWESTKTSMDKFAVGANIAGGILANLGNIIDTFKQGREKGGVLGGVGGVLGSLSPVLESIPVVGQFIPAIAGILSFVGGLFTASAKKIADDVKRNFEKTINSYQEGNASLIETMNELERQRTDAILRLSGTKGGKEQLDEILPEFNRELEQLRKKQGQILDDFDTSLGSLRLQSDTLAQINKQWADINQQVKEYLGAGGDANKASEFLSLQLNQIRQQVLEEFSAAEQEAIRDALKLNDLLKQRNELVEDFKRKEFDLINADAIERRQAGSVTRGAELARLRSQHQEALDNLDQELSRINNKVVKEREIFNLANDSASLRRRDEELTLAALDEQIRKLQELKNIANSFTLGSGGYTSSLLAPIQLTVNFNGPVTTEQASGEIVDTLTGELDRMDRQAIR